jgi:hypothetical protein
VDPITDRQSGRKPRGLTADVNWLTVFAVCPPTGPTRASKVCSSIWRPRPGWAMARPTRLSVSTWPVKRFECSLVADQLDTGWTQTGSYGVDGRLPRGPSPGK